MRGIKFGIALLALVLLISGCSSPGGSSLPGLGGGINSGGGGQNGPGGLNPEDPGFDDGNTGADLPNTFIDDLIARGSAQANQIDFNSKVVARYETVIEYDTGFYGVLKDGIWVTGSIVKNIGTGSALFDGEPPLPGGFQGQDTQNCDLKDKSGNKIGTLAVEYEGNVPGTSGNKQFKISVNLSESYNKAVGIDVSIYGTNGSNKDKLLRTYPITGNTGYFDIQAGQEKPVFDVRIEMWDGHYVVDSSGSDDLFKAADDEYYWVEADGECCWTNPTPVNFIKVGSSKIFILTGNINDTFINNPAGTDQKYSGEHQEPVYTVYTARNYNLIVEGEKAGVVRVTVEAGGQIKVEYSLADVFAKIVKSYMCNGTAVDMNNNAVMLFYIDGNDISLITDFEFMEKGES